jgi:hypothetical protein
MKNYSLTIDKLVEFQSIVQRCFPNSDVIIAGGCLRDILHEKEVSDIDVFIQLGDGESEVDWLQDSVFYQYDSGIKALAARLYSTHKEKLTPQGKAVYDGNSCFRIVDLPEGFRMYPVQLIFRDEDPKEMINSFDFGLCQVWLDRGKLRMSSDYWRDHERQTFHYRPESKAAGRVTSAERIRKLQAKYPGWNFRGVEKIMREEVQVTFPLGPVVKRETPPPPAKKRAEEPLKPGFSRGPDGLIYDPAKNPPDFKRLADAKKIEVKVDVIVELTPKEIADQAVSLPRPRA